MISGNLDMVKLMLESGANPSIYFKDTNGETPLMYATHATSPGKTFKILRLRMPLTKKTVFIPLDRERIFDILLLNNSDLVKETNKAKESIMFFVAKARGK